MKIIVEGHGIETKDIWDIEFICNTREVFIIIKIADKDDVKIGRKIPYETSRGEFATYWNPYQNLYEAVKSKWETDKADVQIFKL